MIFRPILADCKQIWLIVSNSMKKIADQGVLNILIAWVDIRVEFSIWVQRQLVVGANSHRPTGFETSTIGADNSEYCENSMRMVKSSPQRLPTLRSLRGHMSIQL